MFAFRVRDVGPEPPYGVGPGKLPKQGCATYHHDSAQEAGGGGMGVSSAGGSDG